MIKYSIIIPTFNHLEDCLKPCLEAIQRNTRKDDCEVIVVSNGSTDGTEAYVQSLGEPFRLIADRDRLGFPKACNLGMRAASGGYLILLNNDAFLLDQNSNRWINILESPFRSDPQVGITGPFMVWNWPGNSDFLIFFCVMIKRQVLDTIGGLDEIFGNGGCEDVDYCIRAKRAGFKIVQVPGEIKFNYEEKMNVGGFPIFHRGSQTITELTDYSETFKRNEEIVASRYNNQYRLGNEWERHVFGKTDDIKNDIHRREIARYKFARENLTGKRVLELGCSAGYAKRFLPQDIDYLGVDYDQRIINFANENYADEHYRYICKNVLELDWAKLGHFDTIIAFEFLEHLENGRELAQLLKEHCDTLLLTTPYNEPPGLHGKWHKLHWLKEKDFPGFEYHFIQEDGEIHHSPDNDYGHNLIIYKWQKGRIYTIKPRILCFIPTCNRYEILSLSLQSVAMQTLTPTKILIYDDGSKLDLRDHPIYKPLFRMLHSRGIEWEVIFGQGKGQHWGHQLGNVSGYDFIWRIDDDEIAEPDVLEKLMNRFTPEVGAVGGAVFQPGEASAPGTGSSQLIDIYHKPNIQWAPGDEVIEVEHLYSSFVYRGNLQHYRLDLSPVSHREETLFTHGLYRKGYKLLVDLTVKTYHFRQAEGGIRNHANAFYFEHDERLFADQMGKWGYKLINLDVGLGDHLAFSNILPFLKWKYPKLIIGCSYPEVFKDYDVLTIPVSASQPFCKDNIYRWMQDNDWKRDLVRAYATMYGVENEFTDRALRANLAERDAKPQELPVLERVD